MIRGGLELEITEFEHRSEWRFGSNRSTDLFLLCFDAGISVVEACQENSLPVHFIRYSKGRATSKGHLLRSEVHVCYSTGKNTFVINLYHVRKIYLFYTTKFIAGERVTGLLFIQGRVNISY